MTKRRRQPRPILVPDDERAAPQVVARPRSTEAMWATDGATHGIVQDPDHPARFHRKGRGGKPKRTVRRLTVYVADELAVRLDLFLAKAGRSTNRSDVIEQALSEFLQMNQ